VNDLWATAERACTALTNAGVAFGITGGIATIYYGEPRLTQDIDVVVRVPEGQPVVGAIVAALSPGFHIDPETVREEVARGGMFQALDRDTMIRVDFHVGEAVPGELDRCVLREVLPGVQLPLMSKEDLIVAKLLWIRMGSHKSRDDVRAMLRRSDPLDMAVLEGLAAKLGVADLLDEFAPPGGHRTP